MHLFMPMPDQDQDIMRPMNPVAPILPNDEFDPVVNMDGLHSGPMDALSVLSFADMILNG